MSQCYFMLSHTCVLSLSVARWSVTLGGMSQPLTPVLATIISLSIKVSSFVTWRGLCALLAPVLVCTILIGQS